MIASIAQSVEILVKSWDKQRVVRKKYCGPKKNLSHG